MIQENEDKTYQCTKCGEQTTYKPNFCITCMFKPSISEIQDFVKEHKKDEDSVLQDALSLIYRLVEEYESNEETLEWWKNFKNRGQNKPDSYHESRKQGCICSFEKKEDAQQDDFGNCWTLNPECVYHATAAKYPSDHSIPWNCPTFWDGCNCKESIDNNKQQLDSVKEQVTKLMELLRM